MALSIAFFFCSFFLIAAVYIAKIWNICAFCIPIVFLIVSTWNDFRYDILDDIFFFFFFLLLLFLMHPFRKFGHCAIIKWLLIVILFYFFFLVVGRKRWWWQRSEEEYYSKDDDNNDQRGSLRVQKGFHILHSKTEREASKIF